MSDIPARAADGRSHLVRTMTALDDAYDHKRRCYAGDATDETVAKSLALSPVFVAKVRDEHFGPAHLPKPKTVEERLAATEAQIAKLTAQVAELMDAATAPQPAKRAYHSEAPGDGCKDRVLAALSKDKWMRLEEVRAAVKWPGQQNTVSTSLKKLLYAGKVQKKPDTFAKGGCPRMLWRLAP